jgi:hypothetical protein
MSHTTKFGRRRPRILRTILLAATASLAWGGPGEAALEAQEVGAHAAWLAQDVAGVRSLKGGGAYVALPALPFLDVRLDFTSVGRTRIDPVATFCGPAGDGASCVAEGIERDSRLSTIDLGVVAWAPPVAGARIGIGAGAVRHDVSVVEQGVYTRRRLTSVEGRDAFGGSISLHLRVAPPFSPGGAVFASLSRSFVEHDGCTAGHEGVCGGSGTFALRAGVAYRFSRAQR